ncbi:MAG TPA: dihydrofolate reductase [Candidatus Paceibacterota bacterium]|jgi:dihydrofolate reductase
MPEKISRISAVAAIGTRTRALGKEGALIWSFPEDVRRFKALTLGHPVVMGRKTWESIPNKYRPLPGRTNIVVTRSADFSAEGAVVVHSLEEALSAAKGAPGSEEICIIGGGEIYRLALPFTDRLYLTLVDDDMEGDAYFPEYPEFTNVIEDERHPEDIPPYAFITLDR